jgi:integrase/recombinase XerD
LFNWVFIKTTIIPSYKAKLIDHYRKQRIAVQLDNTPDLIERFKKLKGRNSSVSLQVWHLPDTKECRKKNGN